MSTRQYLIVIEKAGKNYSAYSPDLPGCVAMGTTRKQAESNMNTAIQMHLKGLKEDKLRLPVPHSSVSYVVMDSALKLNKTRKSTQSHKPKST